MPPPPRRPLDDIRDLMTALPGPAAAADRGWVAESPSRLEDLAAWLAAWQGHPPSVYRPQIVIFAGNHGVASATPAMASTEAMVAAFAGGRAPLNRVCIDAGIGLKVFDLALEVPTHDIRSEPALAEVDCVATIAYGMEATAGGVDVLGLGSIGVGGDLAAAAVLMALLGGSVADWLADAPGPAIAAVETAVARHADSEADPLELMRRLGGREIAATVGAILAGRAGRVPVILDGLSATAAAAVLQRLSPHAIDHCVLASVAAGPAHRHPLDAIGARPLLDLQLRSGDGMGAALAFALVKAAALAAAG